jgi:integrase
MKDTTATRIATGIYQDACGYQARVQVGRLKDSQRFDLETPLKFMQSWQTQRRAELDTERATLPAGPAPVRGTWAADVAIYLPQIAGRASYKADRSHLGAWAPHIGHLHRTKITAVHVRTAIGVWLTEKKSARTIRHRIRVLRELYQTLDGKHARPPLEDVTLPRVPEPSPTPVSLELIRRVAASLKTGLVIRKRCGPAKTWATVRCPESAACYARFLIRALTGQRPAQLMRALPTDVHLDRKVWFVRPAKGGKPVPLALNAEMVIAWRAFIAADAWGPFDARSFSKTIRRHGWPADVRPYQLRHTFAIDHLQGGTDIGDLQGLLGHAQLETTRKFYAPQQLARLRKAVASRKLKLV